MAKRERIIFGFDEARNGSPEQIYGMVATSYPEDAQTNYNLQKIVNDPNRLFRAIHKSSRDYRWTLIPKQYSQKFESPHNLLPHIVSNLALAFELPWQELDAIKIFVDGELHKIYRNKVLVVDQLREIKNSIKSETGLSLIHI